MSRSASRSYERITRADLRRLLAVARADRREFFESPGRKCRPLRSRVLCTALCQGAALHFLDGVNGVKDFDVWTFYAALPGITFPPRRLVSRDFGSPGFGRSPDRRDLIGRRVDLLGRSIPARSTEDPVTAVRRYLTEARSVSARRLAEKAVVLLEPDHLLGTQVWP